MKSGFTLAEVLITLGIIGVVAAMTIPTLITNTRSQQYRTRYKKSISTLSQAAKMSQAQYGYDYAGINASCSQNAANEHPENTMSICAILNGTLTGATYVNKLSDIKMRKNNKEVSYTYKADKFLKTGIYATPANFKGYILSDGTIIAFYKNIGTQYTKGCSLNIGETIADDYSSGGLAGCGGFIDVNGVSLPNKEVSCSSGINSLKQQTCVVKNDAQHMTDIFPIRFHDGIVEPATAAGRYILRTTK